MSLLYLVVILGIFDQALGHGMVLEPVARGSRWRFDPKAPINYDDNGMYCGGRSKQWNVNSGQCGLCGDDWALPRPRTNELGGKFGNGQIVQSYKQGGNLLVAVDITANHLGYFLYALCSLDKTGGSENEGCFEPLTLVGGGFKHYLNSEEVGWYNATLVLPKDLSCQHCVLQWTYITGNSWGICSDGSEGMGCEIGQENFRTCSDISVNPNDQANELPKTADSVEEAPLD